MSCKITTSSSFRRDFKRCMRRGLDMRLITDAMDLLEQTGTLPASYQPHKLKGDFKGAMECHITPDWLLIYEKKDELRLVRLIRTGTHADLYGK